jgi:D-alanine-D-alanine ligase
VKPESTDSRFGKVALLMGGWSAEREISLKTGNAILAALLARGIDTEAIDADRDVLRRLSEHRYDRAFIAMHGRGGEDGVIQAALELIDMPYTGSGVMASALCMNKLMTKRVWLGAGLPTPHFLLLKKGLDPRAIIGELGLPVIVKPVLEGSSIGMTKVEDVEQLHPAFENALQYGTEVMAEKWVSGGEYTVAILENRSLPVIKLQTPRTFYDFEAKYSSSETLYHCPCGLTESKERMLQQLAIKAFKVAGARGWGRVDIMLDESEQPWLIEINTVPGMTDHSLVPMAAAAAGITFDELVVRILKSSEVSA